MRYVYAGVLPRSAVRSAPRVHDHDPTHVGRGSTTARSKPLRGLLPLRRARQSARARTKPEIREWPQRDVPTTVPRICSGVCRPLASGKEGGRVGVRAAAALSGQCSGRGSKVSARAGVHAKRRACSVRTVNLLIGVGWRQHGTGAWIRRLRVRISRARRYCSGPCSSVARAW